MVVRGTGTSLRVGIELVLMIVIMKFIYHQKSIMER